MKGPIKRRRSNRSIDERMLRESLARDLENDLLSLTMRLTRTLTRYGNNDYSRSEPNVGSRLINASVRSCNPLGLHLAKVKSRETMYSALALFQSYPLSENIFSISSLPRTRTPGESRKSRATNGAFFARLQSRVMYWPYYAARS